MHIDKVQLLDLANRPSHDYNKEGILSFLERTENFFKNNDSKLYHKKFKNNQDLLVKLCKQ